MAGTPPCLANADLKPPLSGVGLKTSQLFCDRFPLAFCAFLPPRPINIRPPDSPAAQLPAAFRFFLLCLAPAIHPLAPIGVLDRPHPAASSRKASAETSGQGAPSLVAFVIYPLLVASRTLLSMSIQAGTVTPDSTHGPGCACQSPSSRHARVRDGAKLLAVPKFLSIYPRCCIALLLF